jgi:hypothetical protein
VERLGCGVLLGGSGLDGIRDVRERQREREKVCDRHC